jgi:hypothetical protein
MTSRGTFGYKIGRKTRLMSVESDADLLWQVCVREIYILMKHYGSIDDLKKAFEKLIESKGNPKPKVIEKCKMFTELTITDENIKDWYHLTRYCQHSFINILESGYILNNGKDEGLVFIIDFNTNLVSFYTKDQKKIKEHEKATIQEIMEFDDMPTKCYEEIIADTKSRFVTYSTNIERVNIEIKKIEEIINKAKQINDHNIIIKAQKLLDDMVFERKKLETEYRYFYNRLDALNLIDHSDN